MTSNRGDFGGVGNRVSARNPTRSMRRFFSVYDPCLFNPHIKYKVHFLQEIGILIKLLQMIPTRKKHDIIKKWFINSFPHEIVGTNYPIS